MNFKRMAMSAAVFTPGAPINKYDLFSGRASQVTDVINAVFQRGRHVVLYGERGVGKTSLANVLSEQLPEGGFVRMNSNTVNCDATDDFESIWRKALREFTFSQIDKPIGFSSDASEHTYSLDQYLGDKVTPDEVRYLLQYRLAVPAIIVIDEIDRIKDRATTTQMADTIKNLSDHSVDVTLILVGVADSVSELIAEHASIERALIQVQMPRMSKEEMFGIVDRGLRELEMTIEPEARAKIALLSQGLPEYTHSLSLYASQNAINADRACIDDDDVRTAIKTAVDKTQQSIKESYHKATSSPRKDNLFAHVLLACAFAPKDMLGYFQAAGVRDPLCRITGKNYGIASFIQHLNEFTQPARGLVLQRTGEARKYRFRFINPLMQPFVIAHGLAKGLLSEATLNRMPPETTEDPDAS